MQNVHEKIIAVIDWLRFTCIWGNFAPSSLDGDTRELFRILKVDMSQFVGGNKALHSEGFDDGFLYAESLNVGTECRPDSRARGVSDCFMVDMPATACHQFEDRGGCWKDLFLFLSRHAVRFNRIDLAQDSINGLQMPDIKKKIDADEFVCPFRAVVPGGHRGDQMYTHIHDVGPLGDLDPDPVVLDTRKGYTCTFGNHGSTQELQIYDKSRERQNKGIGVTCRSWIRFEARFSKERAGYVVRNFVLPSLEKDEFGKMVSSLIRGLLEFKEVPKGCSDVTRHNYVRLPIWKPYNHFLGRAEPIKVPSCQNKVEASVTRSVDWGKKAWTSTLVRLFTCGEKPFREILLKMIDDLEKDGFSWEVLSQARQYFYSEAKYDPSASVPSTEDLIGNLQMWCDSLCPDHPVNCLEKFQEYLARHPAEGSDGFYKDVVLGPDSSDRLPSGVDPFGGEAKPEDAICLDGLDLDEGGKEMK
jgi:hypothetical protein